MKTKLLLTALLLSSLTQGQTLVKYLESPYITSTVYYDGSKYHYEYQADSKINNRDISNITINLCDPCELYCIYGDDSYKIEYKEDSIKFDDIKPKGNEFVFGFYSVYAPNINEAYIKASNRTYTNSIFSPSCQIPEPSVLALSFGLIILAKRRR